MQRFKGEAAHIIAGRRNHEGVASIPNIKMINVKIIDVMDYFYDTRSKK